MKWVLLARQKDFDEKVSAKKVHSKVLARRVCAHFAAIKEHRYQTTREKLPRVLHGSLGQHISHSERHVILDQCYARARLDAPKQIVLIFLEHRSAPADFA